MLRLLKLVFLILVTQVLHAQKNYPTNDFIPPIDIPLKLAGTFGELRSNHFHSGIDIKTGEKTGLNVYAIGDGYVSRIKVQAGGYGKALYITHPNGYVSVYAHLNKYNDKINEFVTLEQYLRKSFEVDLYLEPGKLEVKQGEILAFTGNSGHSAGPHLHFEIRDEASQKPVNPLLFGYSISDRIKPDINMLRVYPATPDDQINGKNKPADFYPVSANGMYLLAKIDTLYVAGSAYFGINTIDQFNNGLNKNGVYSIRVIIDGKETYSHELETFSFDETRYVNSLIDYKEYKLHQRRIQKTFIQPNNRLSIYENVVNKGIYYFPANTTSEITIEVADANGNISTLRFWVKGKSPVDKIKTISNANKTLFGDKKTNTFKTQNLVLEVPGDALYDTLYFEYKQLKSIPKTYSGLHQLHYDFVPLHTTCNLAIWPDSLPLSLQDKALIAKVEENNEFIAAGGEWIDGFIKTGIREFGIYTIIIDTIPPSISPVNIRSDKSLIAQTSIMMTIRDELSGIASYNGYLNNQWILMEYDEKNDLLTYFFDKYLKDGENDFRLEVTDWKNNRAIYKQTLTY